jgi:hypothetical protein
MAKATELYNLRIINPDLVKEWHPSRNGDLNPSNVTPGSGKKVWWICAEGHEWEATVKSRMKGNDCPFCIKDFSTIRPSRIQKNTGLENKISYTVIQKLWAEWSIA